MSQQLLYSAQTAIREQLRYKIVSYFAGDRLVKMSAITSNPVLLWADRCAYPLVKHLGSAAKILQGTMQVLLAYVDGRHSTNILRALDKHGHWRLRTVSALLMTCNRSSLDNSRIFRFEVAVCQTYASLVLRRRKPKQQTQENVC